MNKNLAELLQKKHQASQGISSIDWDERRETFLAAVQTLYEQVERIFAEPSRQKLVELERRPKSLTESYLGTYTIDDLIVTVGSEQVRFSPRGRNVAGAEGRVDVIGERGEAILVLQPNQQWAFLQSRQPHVSLLPFDESTLTEVLQDVMRD